MSFLTHNRRGRYPLQNTASRKRQFLLSFFVSMPHTTMQATERQAINIRYHRVLQQIEQAKQRYHRHDTVQLLAVSKKQTLQKIKMLAQSGQQVFAESYVQEALQKIEALSDWSLEWHFIGPIQSNKTRAIARHFSVVHSVDRLKIAKRLNQHRMDAALDPLPIFLQININAEASKSGFSYQQALQIIPDILHLSHLRLTGLMAIPQKTSDTQLQYQNFYRLKALQAEINQQYNLQLEQLSMGMSADMEAAIRAGSTIVRIGTALFGSRDNTNTA